MQMVQGRILMVNIVTRVAKSLRKFMIAGVVLPVVLLHATFPAAAKAPVLSLPLECEPQKTCFIQNYVDLDASKGVHDYSCHKGSYDGHKGTDFRVLSVAEVKRGVDVLASAPGVVTGVRDGMKDRMLASGAEWADRRACGNGVVIDHGDGWQTQYCHMRRGSLVVKKGDRVTRGQKLGLVGLSGKTAFPHVHLSVRHKARVIDPFRGAQPSKAACSRNKTGSLWQQDVLQQFPYSSGQPFMWGFTDGEVQKEYLIERGGVPVPRDVKAHALVFYGMALNLLKGDRLHVRLTGPKGVITDATSEPMDNHKATQLLFSGRKRVAFAWPRGTYQGVFSLERDGKTVWKKVETLELK